jgi:hypothetical protein
VKDEGGKEEDDGDGNDDKTCRNYCVFGVCPSVGIRGHTIIRTLQVFYDSLEYRTMDKFQKPSNSECYTPSSEPFTSVPRFFRTTDDGQSPKTQ